MSRVGEAFLSPMGMLYVVSDPYEHRVGASELVLDVVVFDGLSGPSQVIRGATSMELAGRLGWTRLA